MNSLRIYKLVFYNTIDDLNILYDKFSESDKKSLTVLESESYFDYEFDNKFYFYVIAKSNLMTLYTDVLKKNKMIFKLHDLTDDLMSHSINLCDYIVEHSIALDKNILIDFLSYVDEMIYNNLDIDSILDRINKVGMDKLTETELDFLKNYNS